MRKILLYLFLSSFSYVLYGQDLQNASNIFIPTSLGLFTDGNIVNNGFLQNNGTISFKGNWLNHLTYQGTGNVLLDGVDQVFLNNNQPIENITINGGGSKTLQGKLIVRSNIYFNEGIFIVRDIDTLLMSADCQVNGGSISSYVDGGLTSTGTGYKFFPVGKNGKYHPVELTEIKGIDPLVEITVFEGLPSAATTPKAKIYQDIYWSRNTIAGTFESSPVMIGYKMPTNVDPIRFIIAESSSPTSDYDIFDNTTFQIGNDIDIIGTPVPVTKSIIAVGELLMDPPRKQYMSTTLSPNADNPINRVIKVFGDNPNPSDFYFQVFNRWGVLIFETQSYAKMSTDGWDGRQQGTLLSSGVYPYSIKYIDTSGSTVHTTGFITVIN